MDDLVSAYFNVYGCEAIQENFSLLGEKRYVVSEAPFQIYGPPAHGPSDAEKVPIGKPYKDRKGAKRRADKLDLEIGGYRHQVRRVPEEPVNEENIGEEARPGQNVRGFNRASLPSMTDRRLEISGSPFRSKTAKNKMDKTNVTAANAQAHYWRTSLNKEELDYILGLLVSEGYTNSYESAACILEAMSDAWLESLVEEIRLTGQPPTHLNGKKRVIPAAAFEDPDEEAKKKRRRKRGKMAKPEIRE